MNDDPEKIGAYSAATAPRLPRVMEPVRSETLLRGRTRLPILHNNEIYILRQTRLGKLILTK